VAGTIIVCGGEDTTVTQQTSCEQSNAGVTSWSFITPMPMANAYLSMVTLNGSPYILGAYGGGSTRSDVRMWDGVSTWVSKASLPAPRDSHNVLALTEDTVLLCGGVLAGTLTATCFIYMASTNNWTTAPPMAQARLFFGFVMSEGRMFYINTHTRTHNCRQDLCDGQ
jgi:hypothetical protein